MSKSPPFIDRESGALQPRQIWTEAFPLIGLILLFGAIALVPYAVVSLGPLGFLLDTILVMLMQFILLVGLGVFLLYSIARGIQLADG